MAQATTLFVQAAPTIITGSGNSGALNASSYRELDVDINITAVSGGASPSIQFFVDRQGADGNWYVIWTGAVHSAAGSESDSIGAGLSKPVAFGSTIRVRWAVTGTSPSFTLSSSWIGK